MVTLALYRKVFGRALTLTLANWPVVATLFVYALAMAVAVVVAAPFGIVGGIALGFVWAACLGSFLYVVEMVVRTSRVTFEDFRRSFGAYLGDVLGVLFIFWVVSMVAGPALAAMPNGFALLLAIELVAFVFFNAVPELIYLGHYSSLELLRESYVFIGENWIEWFPATIAAAVLVGVAAALPAPGPSVWLKNGLVALLVYFAMVVRGLLFIELSGSSRRARAFRYRMDRSV